MYKSEMNEESDYDYYILIKAFSCNFFVNTNRPSYYKSLSYNYVSIIAAAYYFTLIHWIFAWFNNNGEIDQEQVQTWWQFLGQELQYCKHVMVP